jgi:hypothetical protein
MDRKKDTIGWKKGKMPQHGDGIVVVKIEDFWAFHPLLPKYQSHIVIIQGKICL